MVYVDDLIMFTNTVDEHVEQIAQILTPLRQAGTIPRLNTCFLIQKRTEYLGHIVEAGEFYVSKKVIDAVREMEPQITKTQLRSVLAM